MASAKPFETPEAESPESADVESVGKRIRQFVVPPT
jgi:hypothetical protein